MKKLALLSSMVGLLVLTSCQPSDQAVKKSEKNANAASKGKLVVYCSVQNSICEASIKSFSEKYGIKTDFTRNGTGAILTKLEAEKHNPQADVWYGGTFDPHSQAGEMDLLIAYQSKHLPEIMEQFRDPAARKGNYSSVFYMGILGFGVNTQRLKKLGIDTIPQCWEDLTDPRLKGEIQIADAQSSGTAYTAIATFVQLWGEDKAFEFMKKLHNNISQYPKSGTAPSRNVARGEATIGIGFLQNYTFEQEQGAPIIAVAPCEGTGYELGGVSIIKGARNLDNAKLFVDYVLSKEGQNYISQTAKAHYVLSNTKAHRHERAQDPKSLKLINYDFTIYGSAKVREHLLRRWVHEVKLAQ